LRAARGSLPLERHKLAGSLRDFTDRPEAVKAGFAELVSVEKEAILRTIRRCIENPSMPKVPSPYGDGRAAERIMNIIRNNPPPRLGLLKDKRKY